MTAHHTGKQVFIGSTPVADAYSEEAAARIVAALNAGDLDLPPAETRAMLPPDEEDIRLVLHGTIPRCPCCKGTPTTFARHFPHSGIYQAYVHCSHCDVQVFKNARDLDEARQLAIATWSKRPTETPLPDGAPVLRFSDAEQIGGELHDRWQVFAGSAPMARDDMGWADDVQFVVRRAREIKTEREREEG